MGSYPVIIIVPAFNEERHVRRVVSGLKLAGFDDVVVVDDGSHDRTAYEARLAGAVVIRHVINRGQGAALETGNEYARARGAAWVAHIDGDDQFNPADIVSALERARKEQADVIIGSRFLDDRTKLPFTKKHIVFPVARLINTLLTGVKLTDVHNGFRLFSRRALSTISLKHDGMAHNTEFIAQIKRHGLAFVEHPVEVRYHEYGQGWRAGWRILKDWCVGWFVS